MPIKFLKKIGKVTLFFIGFILVLIIIAFVFVQTQTFNKYALEYTLNELNLPQQLRQNKINAESIEGNILSGIRLNKGSITVREDTLLSFNYLEVKYSLWGFLDKKILVHELMLKEPVIKISRIEYGDSLRWNFENLFGPREIDTTPAAQFDWDVVVENLKIENGFIRIIGDSLKPEAKWKSKRSLMQFFDFNQTDVSELNVELNVKYYKDFKAINIKNISFNTNSEFNLHKLQLNANLHVKDTVTEIWGFEAITDKSDLKIYYLSIDKFNPFLDFNYEELGEKNIKASVDLQKINFDELVFFFPEANFLDSVIGIKIDADGKFGGFKAQIVSVRLPNSVINLTGKIINLQKPDSLYLDLTGDNITINTRDIKTVYKREISDFGYIGTVKANLHYKGTLKKFYSDFALNTKFGYADGTFNYNTETESYSGNINTRKLNLGRILRNNSLTGGINLSARFNGRGFSLNKMNANVIYSMNSSRIGKYDVKSSYGKINAVNGNIQLDVKHASSMGNAVVNGRINISNLNNPVYNLSGRVEGLDVSVISGSADDKSNLNCVFEVNGRGSSVDNINGTYKLNIGDSYYGKYQIPATQVDAEISINNSNRKVQISTDMADFNAEGSIKMDDIIYSVLYNVSQAQNQIIKRAGAENLLSHYALIQNAEFSNEYNANQRDFYFKYSFDTKDSAKLEKVLNPFGIRFNGNADGEINNSSGKFTSVTKLDIRNFGYCDTVINVKNLKMDFVFNNAYSNSMNGLDIKLQATSDDISFGANRFDSVAASYNMIGNKADFGLFAVLDTSAKGNIRGVISFGDRKIDAEIDSVFVNYSGYRVQNSGTWVLSFEEGDRLKFRQFDLKSQNAVINVNGEFSIRNESDLKIEGNNIKITDIAAIINKTDSSHIPPAENGILGEIDKLYVGFKGTSSDPVINADIKTSMLSYKDTDIGTITSKMNYETNSVAIDIVMNNAKGNGKMTLKGNVPYANPLSGDSLSITEVSSTPMNINLKADNFLLDYFSVLTSNIESLRGVINADLSAKGSAADPQLSGNLKITNGGYLLPLTGMYYGFNVDMSTDNFKLILNNFRLYNEDDESKNINISGSLDFTNMKITGIDLEAKGDMVLLDKDVESNDLGLYGYIYAGIGNPRVKIKGSTDSLFISGQFLIKEATISSVPVGGGYNNSNDNFIYIDSETADSLRRVSVSLKNSNYNLKADSVKFIVDSVEYVSDSLIIITLEKYNMLNPFDRMKYKVSDESEKQTFINLDVNFKTQKDLYASIDFNRPTKDRLYGKLKVDLDIKTEDGKINGYGSVVVDRDSYYRFYRDFKLDESQIKFDGDLTNPFLDLKGVFESEKSNEQLGLVTTSHVEVVGGVKGYVKEPQIFLKLFVDGSEISGGDAQSEAVTYLLFGRFKNELTPSERSSVSSSLGQSVGSMYASSYFSQSIREILPFIVDAQLKYSEGDVKNADIELVSDLGNATVKYGGKLLSDVKNFEIVVDYPLNKVINLNLPESLLFEFAHEQKDQSFSSSNTENVMTTEVKILYKIKF